RGVGVIMPFGADDPLAQLQIGVMLYALQELGWSIGRNVLLDYRWAAGSRDRYRPLAAELVALAPDILVTSTGTMVGALQEITQTVPIVFVGAIDAVGGG